MTTGRWVGLQDQDMSKETLKSSRFAISRRVSCKSHLCIYACIYAQICKPETTRTLFALAAQWGLERHQMDVKAAYLNSLLSETVYMEQPEGFTEGNDKMCLLQRSLYGLKQAGRVWFQTLSSFLEETGFIRSKNDYCLFISNVGDELCYVLVWINDIIIGCKS